MTFFDYLMDIITANGLMDYVFSLIIILAFTIIGPMLSTSLIKLFHIKEKKLLRIKRHAFYKPLKGFISILGVYIALRTLTLPYNIVEFIDKSFRIITIVLVSNALANLFNYDPYHPDSIRKFINFSGNDALISFVCKIIKILIYIIASFIVINELGYNLGGLAAGLGVFSAVLALAAQDLAKNIIAGCSIITDKPFDIGDFVEIDSITGTIEDITFRSTRIRNLENQIVVIPNSKIADTTLINFNKMQKRRFTLELTLELSTDLNKVLTVLEKIKSLLVSNEHIYNENIKTYFKTVSSNGIDIVVDFYTDVVDYLSFLQFKQEMNYEILDLIHKQNVSLAYNTQTLYVKNLAEQHTNNNPE